MSGALNFLSFNILPFITETILTPTPTLGYHLRMTPLYKNKIQHAQFHLGAKSLLKNQATER